METRHIIAYGLIAAIAVAIALFGLVAARRRRARRRPRRWH